MWCNTLSFLFSMLPLSLALSARSPRFRFDLYGQQGAKVLLWLLFPLVPVILYATLPFSVHYTNSIKPITQVIIHVSPNILILNNL